MWAKPTMVATKNKAPRMCETLSPRPHLLQRLYSQPSPGFLAATSRPWFGECISRAGKGHQICGPSKGYQRLERRRKPNSGGCSRLSPELQSCTATVASQEPKLYWPTRSPEERWTQTEHTPKGLFSKKSLLLSTGRHPQTKFYSLWNSQSLSPTLVFINSKNK